MARTDPGRGRRAGARAHQDRRRVSEYVTLRPAGGGNVKGLCPFHDEKTPSFNVTPARASTTASAAARAATPSSSCMDDEHLTFVEAVERLAGRAGDPAALRRGRPAPVRAAAGQRQRLIAAHAAAAEFYAEQLGTPGARGGPASSSPSAASTRPPRERYGCGFAPDGWDALTKHLRQQGFTAEELVTARPGQAGALAAA